MHFNKTATAALAGSLLLACGAARAQTGGTTAGAAARDLRGFAASSLQAPVAFGARWGTAGVGLYGQGCDCNGDDADGSLGLAFGLGNPDDLAALEVSVAASSLFGDKGSDDGFAEAGSLGFKLHTNLPGYASFAVGVNGTGRWGSDGFTHNNRSSVYAVASKMVPLGSMAAVLNLGVGDQLYNEPGEKGAALFGSGALYFTPQISLIGEYTGRFANAAVSFAPFRSYGLTVTLGATYLGERYGGSTEFAGSIVYGFSFL